MGDGPASEYNRSLIDSNRPGSIWGMLVILLTSAKTHVHTTCVQEDYLFEMNGNETK